MREKLPAKVFASAFTSRVFPRPGTPSISTWPPASRQASVWSIAACCPTTAARISLRIRWTMSAACCMRSARALGGVATVLSFIVLSQLLEGLYLASEIDGQLRGRLVQRGIDGFLRKAGILSEALQL